MPESCSEKFFRWHQTDTRRTFQRTLHSGPRKPSLRFAANCRLSVKLETTGRNPIRVFSPWWSLTFRRQSVRRRGTLAGSNLAELLFVSEARAPISEWWRAQFEVSHLFLALALMFRRCQWYIKAKMKSDEKRRTQYQNGHSELKALRAAFRCNYTINPGINSAYTPCWYILFPALFKRWTVFFQWAVYQATLHGLSFPSRSSSRFNFS